MMFCAVRGKHTGFTLIEIMIVIAIIAILAGIAIPNISEARQEAKFHACVENCRVVGEAITMFLMRHSESDLVSASRGHNTHGNTAFTYWSPESAFGWCPFITDCKGDNCVQTALIERGYLNKLYVCTSPNPRSSQDLMVSLNNEYWTRGHWVVQCTGDHEFADGGWVPAYIVGVGGGDIWELYGRVTGIYF